MRCLNSRPGFHEPQNVRQTRRDAVSRVPGVTIRWVIEYTVTGTAPERTGRPLGGEKFLVKLERMLGKVLRPQKGGRPHKAAKQKGG